MYIGLIFGMYLCHGELNCISTFQLYQPTTSCFPIFWKYVVYTQFFVTVIWRLDMITQGVRRLVRPLTCSKISSETSEGIFCSVGPNVPSSIAVWICVWNEAWSWSSRPTGYSGCLRCGAWGCLFLFCFYRCLICEHDKFICICSKKKRKKGPSLINIISARNQDIIMVYQAVIKIDMV